MVRPKKRVKITGESVPPGSLGRNPHNPNSDMTPEERWADIVRDCAIIVAESCRRRVRNERLTEREG